MYILIPAYKPDEKMLKLIADLRRSTDFSILVVDDGSGPDYQHIFEAVPPSCTVLRHEINQGKGRAMKTGFAWLLKNDADCGGVIIVDADGQHLPEDAIRVAGELTAHPQSLVIGARHFTGNVPFRSRFGNKLTRAVFAFVSGVHVTDTQTGLRGISASLLQLMTEIKGERYEYEMNMLLYAAERGIEIQEVKIETVYIEDNASSHFHVFRDSLRIYGVIFKFAFSSFMGYLIDFGMVALLNALTQNRMSEQLSLFISVVGARIVSSVCNYAINKRFVFKVQSHLGATFLRYYLLVAAILLANYALMSFFKLTLGLPILLAKLIVELALFFVSFYCQRRFVFRKTND